MRILIAIPHFFSSSAPQENDEARHGSLGRNALPRIEAISACISALRQQFDPSQSVIEIARRITRPANQSLSARLDLIVVTTGENHLVDELQVEPGSFEHWPTSSPAPFLGVQARSILRERFGLYDYYGYMEDDLIVRDPWLFAKLNWFNAQVGDDRLLLPNRYEVGRSGVVKKAYVDGDLAEGVISRFIDVNEDPVIHGNYLGNTIRFERARNPHSGCFFLNSRQMGTMAARADYLDHDASFIGPLESAATLPILRTFRIFKPSRENAAFLEIEHFGTGFLGQIRMPLEGELEAR